MKLGMIGLGRMGANMVRRLFSLFFCAILLISTHSAFPKLEDVIYDVLPKDAIWAIHIPAFALADERASYSPEERVIGMEINGDARAYPEKPSRGSSKEPVWLKWSPRMLIGLPGKISSQMRICIFRSVSGLTDSGCKMV